MVVSHIPVVDALDEILRHEGAAAPPKTLLQGAYDAMIASLKADTARTFDRNYVEGQVDYQKGNAALSDTRSRTAPTRTSSEASPRRTGCQGRTRRPQPISESAFLEIAVDPDGGGVDVRCEALTRCVRRRGETPAFLYVSLLDFTRAGSLQHLICRL
jgi:hypothetical protein